MKKYLVLILLAASAYIYAQVQPSQTVELSILTCQPGDPLYSKYGHTAIHITDTAMNVDAVFNYGVFDFNTPNFIPLFIAGKTDYMLDIEPTEFFYTTCRMVGRQNIYEQRLNLPYSQKCAVINALLINSRPENCYYRYNFVFDNCATRPYRLIKKALGVQLSTPEFDKREDTFRDMIRYYSGKYTWGGYAINLLFGKDADRIMRPEERLFLPEQLMDYLSEAVMPDGSPLTTQVNELHSFEPDNGHWFSSPQAVELLLLILAIVFGIIDRRRRKISWWLDAVLLLPLIFIGLVITYLSFFSSHPLVGHNFNLIFLNPLSILLLILICIPKTRHWLTYSPIARYGITAWFAIGMLTIFLSGQKTPFLMIPTALFLHIALSWWNSVPNNTAHTHSNRRRKAMILCVLLFPALTTFAQTRKLTVVALVDGMSDDAMTQLKDYWQAGGLRTISENALHTNVTFSQLAYGGAELTATMLTGTNPAEHGIISDCIMSRKDRAVHSIFEDETQYGIGIEQKLSPNSIKTLTVTDEFRLQHGADAKIYAVGITAENTITLAGHTANACCWLGGKRNHWVTTSYYPEGLPAQADAYNVSGKIEKATSATWIPSMDINMYLHPTATEKQQKGFSYDPAKVLKNTPVANQLVTDLALEIQAKNNMGNDQTPDMLLLEYTVVSPKDYSDYLVSTEQEEMYISLNKEIGYLIDQLKKRVGLENVKFVLMGKPHTGRSEKQMKDANLNIGHFDVNRASALINTYLMAIYGHERWIDGGYGQSIFLNRTLIEQKNMSLSDMQYQVAQFLLEFEGVKEAYPIWQVPMLRSTRQTQQLQNSCCFQRMGDVVFTLEDNYLLYYSEKPTDHLLSTEISAPLYLLMESRSAIIPLYILQRTGTSQPTYIPMATDIKKTIL